MDEAIGKHEGIKMKRKPRRKEPQRETSMMPALENLKNSGVYLGAKEGLWPDPVETEGALKSTEKARKIADKL